MPDSLSSSERLAEIDPSLGRGTRLPLAAVLLAVVLVVTLVPVGVSSLWLRSSMIYELTGMEQERQMRMADSVARGFDAEIERVRREAVKIGQPLASASERPGAPLYLTDFLDDLVVLARFTRVDGMVSAAKKPELVLPVALEQALLRHAQLLFDRGVTPVPASALEPDLDGPFVLVPENVIAIVVSAPVQQHGRLLGVYQELAVLQRPWEAATAIVQPPRKLFLVRKDGSLIKTSGSGGRDETNAAIRGREIVKNFVNRRGRDTSGTRQYTLPGKDGPRRMLGSYAATANDWGVLVEVDEGLALAPIGEMTTRLRRSALLGVCLAGVAALVLGTIINRPVARLAQISKRLADGDFSVQASASRVSELDALGVNFNKMAARLGELVERFRTAAREANDMFLGTIRALAEAIDEKDPYTKGHSVRVNRYAVIIARYLGLSRDEMRNLQISSLLHDVGKIGIDDAILKKPAALSPEEFAVMKTHPERGAKIMGRIPQMRNIISGMRFHHERYSGGGYPLGLQREEIPLQARIIAVADTLDAMITDRPYQKAMSVSEAVSRLNDLKGRLLDPQVIEAFNRAFEAGEFEDLLAPVAHHEVPEAEPRTDTAGASVVPVVPASRTSGLPPASPPVSPPPSP